jgi:hypothetical protein
MPSKIANQPTRRKFKARSSAKGSRPSRNERIAKTAANFAGFPTCPHIQPGANVGILHDPKSRAAEETTVIFALGILFHAALVL